MPHCSQTTTEAADRCFVGLRGPQVDEPRSRARSSRGQRSTEVRSGRCCLPCKADTDRAQVPHRERSRRGNGRPTLEVPFGSLPSTSGSVENWAKRASSRCGSGRSSGRRGWRIAAPSKSLEPAGEHRPVVLVSQALSEVDYAISVDPHQVSVVREMVGCAHVVAERFGVFEARLGARATRSAHRSGGSGGSGSGTRSRTVRASSSLPCSVSARLSQIPASVRP